MRHDDSILSGGIGGDALPDLGLERGERRASTALPDLIRGRGARRGAGRSSEVRRYG